MKNVKPTPYVSPEMDIITFECNDIVTASGGNGWSPDDGEISDW